MDRVNGRSAKYSITTECRVVLNKFIQKKNKLKTKWKRNSQKELAKEAKNGQLKSKTISEKLLNC
jgi:hypothetical protein